MFFCSICGRKGDVIDWVRGIHGLSFKESLDWLQSYANARVTKATSRVPAQSYRQVAAEKAHAIGLWISTTPLAGTTGEIYLTSKGMVAPIPTTLRFITKWAAKDDANWHLEPKCASIIASLQDASGDVVGVHQIYLADSGLALAAKAVPKRNRGGVHGSAIRLDPPGPKIIICDDLESGLAIMRLQPNIPVWVSPIPGSMSDMEVPQCVESVCIAVGKNPNRDAAVQAALEKIRASFATRGKSVTAIAPRAEFNSFGDELFGISRCP